jgi:hypothetical protein
MAILKVSLLSLIPSTTPSSFLEVLKDSSLGPIITARVIQWIIRPTLADYLLSHNWDFMLILEPETTFPPTLTSLIANTFSPVKSPTPSSPCSNPKTNPGFIQNPHKSQNSPTFINP